MFRDAREAARLAAEAAKRASDTAGGVIGALLVAAALVAVVLVLRRRRNNPALRTKTRPYQRSVSATLRVNGGGGVVPLNNDGLVVVNPYAGLEGGGFGGVRRIGGAAV